MRFRRVLFALAVVAVIVVGGTKPDALFPPRILSLVSAPSGSAAVTNELASFELLVATGDVDVVCNRAAHIYSLCVEAFPDDTNVVCQAAMNEAFRACLRPHPMPNEHVFKWQTQFDAKMDGMVCVPDFFEFDEQSVVALAAEFRWTEPYQTTNLYAYTGATTNMWQLWNWIDSYNHSKRNYRDFLLRHFGSQLNRYFGGMTDSARDSAISNFINTSGVNSNECVRLLLR